jgi:glycosyltransferase involved in cell wall biosynthesis
MKAAPIKVSIIMPVYNAGPHFRPCIESLVNQTIKEIEIIIVLDCPTDGTDKIAKEYAARDKRIILISNDQNIHIGLSRNRGLEFANGEYIAFSDHDDVRELNMYEELYNEAKKNESDIVFSGFGYIRNDGIERCYYPDELQAEDRIFSLLIGFENEAKEWAKFIRNGGIWNKIYKKSLINKYHIKFEDNRETTFEDLFFQIKCFYFASKVTCLNQIYYYHIEDINNTANSYNYYSYRLILNYLKKLKHFLIEHNIYKKYLYRYRTTVIYFTIASIQNELLHRKRSFLRMKIFRDLRNEEIIRDAFRAIPAEKANLNIKSNREFTRAKVLFFILANSNKA